MSNVIKFHLPVRPYSPIDALNRSAAARGSPGYAMKASSANYNGHHVNLTWNECRKFYIAEYFWGERVVVEQGEFGPCLAAVLKGYNRGALGASASVCPRADDTAAIALCETTKGLVAGSEQGGDWYTWQHECAAAGARDSANPREKVMRFDWDLMQAAASRDEYHTALRAKYGSVWGY